MGNFPEEWNYGLIKLIHKGNDIYDPNNYRGITLNSCLGKLFCTILYNRLATIFEQENIYCKEQGVGWGSARNIEQLTIYSF